MQLLVFLLLLDAADRHPECMWTTAEDSSFVVFHCFWFGAYPTPTLNWTDVTGGQLLAAKVTDSLAVRLNRSVLSDGQTLRCKAQHQALAPEKDMSCTFTLSKHVVVKLTIVLTVVTCYPSEFFM